MIVMPPGDIADRLSIMTLKMERLSHIDPEYGDYNSTVHRLALGGDTERLYEVNAAIWDLEFDIRRGKDGELGLEEVGRRALKIRDLNKKRISIKNEINERYGRAHEVKGQHASA